MSLKYTSSTSLQISLWTLKQIALLGEFFAQIRIGSQETVRLLTELLQSAPIQSLKFLHNQ